MKLNLAKGFGVAALSERGAPCVIKRNSARAAIGGAAVKTAGGTEELHSRSGRVGFIRPCRGEALSGRRAAQDGQGTMPGGPERAEVKGSCETLSAGRAAAPGARVSSEGRGRSADRVARVLAERAKPAALVGPVEARPCERAGAPFQAMARAVFFAVAAVGLFVGPAAAQTFVKPGDEGTIEFPIENILPTDGPAEGVKISARVEPAEFASAVTIDEAGSTIGPLDVASGQTRTFVVKYIVGSGAPEGSFNIVLHADMITVGASPDLTDPASDVLFARHVSQCSPLLQSAARGGRRPPPNLISCSKPANAN